ncbi:MULTISPECIES: hypothetical protein [Mycobacterium]|uniref:Uncharacterized protein n=3 Tax=Mycobacterium TaxID=1763 RepID=A0A2G5PQK0_MYCCE|nr:MULTISPECIES: hypothetical protein [Mycobacterium]MCV7232779.1 hypothetical protein [Mycobacterium branderi]ORA40917.1 hypothetical protein BST20_01855 [Mycobacterium branderi]PIB80546.1 hypothetical protein CQY23_03125 [Mycobacterium celatum]BBZ09811.1 hypothetical protein MBRA_00060 [Mycobacterium branderi]
MTTAVQMARTLADNVTAIAAHQDAGRCYREIQKLIDDIEYRINRPKPPRFLGPCPHLVTRRQACAMQLVAPRDATEVRCPTCGTLHQVDHLIELLRNHLLYEPLSAVQIVGSRVSDLPGALEQLGDKLSRSTFYSWCKRGWLKPRSYQTRAGVRLPQRQNDSDEPMYWLADVYALIEATRENKPA